MKPLKTTLAAACLGLAFCNIAYSLEEGLKGNPSKMPEDGMTLKPDSVMMKDGKMIMMKDGKTSPMMEDATMANGTKVMRDGTVILKDATTMKLGEDDMVLMTGKIDKKEHLILKGGTMMVVRNGKTTPMTMETSLEDGSKVMMDGTVVKKDGTTSKIGESEMILMEGKIMKIPKMAIGPKSKTQ